MEKLTDLPNIGKEMEKQLNRADIFSFEELKKVGAKETWLRILSFDSSACFHRLCGIEGAIEGVRWHYLSEEKKAELKAFYNEIKGK